MRAGGRRRVAGLRREEVAALAGIGTSWYAMLEQGRVVRVGPKVVEGLAAALRFSDAERAYVYGLTQDPPAGAPAASHLDSLESLIHRAAASAFFVSTDFAYVLAWNTFADELFDFTSEVPEKRNLLAMMVRQARLRAAFPDWHSTLAHMVGVFRAAYARTTAGSAPASLVAALGNEDGTFFSLWNEHAVFAATPHICLMRDRLGTEHAFHFLLLRTSGHAHESLIALVPCSPAC